MREEDEDSISMSGVKRGERNGCKETKDSLLSWHPL